MVWMMYGLATLIVLAIAWASGQHVLQKTGLCMLLSWATANLAVFILGFQDAPFITPIMDGLIAVVVAVVGYRNRSLPALLVVALFVVEEAIHVLAFTHGTVATHGYYLALNMVFVAQLVVLGGASGLAALDRIAPSPSRLQHRRARV